MRKIENQMLRAIHERKDWCSNNTSVTHESFRDAFGITQFCMVVKLHGHAIVRMLLDQNKVCFDNCGYATTTTRSRLNACASLCNEYIRFNIIQRTMHYRKGSPDAKPQPMIDPVYARLY